MARRGRRGRRPVDAADVPGDADPVQPERHLRDHPTHPGWCYVTGGMQMGGGCSQAIQFTQGTPPSGAGVTLQCIEATGT